MNEFVIYNVETHAHVTVTANTLENAVTEFRDQRGGIIKDFQYTNTDDPAESGKFRHSFVGAIYAQYTIYELPF